MSKNPLSKCPTFLYGTAWKEDKTAQCVEAALKAGFTGIDTANQRKHYFEVGVGEALKNTLASGQVKRTDLFIQTKFTFLDGQDERLPYDPMAPVATQVAQSFASSLEHLGVSYLDSYVLHGPSSSHGVSTLDHEVWRQMEALFDQGRVKALGVSNVSLDQLKSFYDLAKIKPAFVQNRCFARRAWDHEIRKFCSEHGIVYQGFSLLTANPEVFANPNFAQLVKKYGKTPAQILFRFAQQVGMLPLTGTTDPDHMAEDLACSQFDLNSNDLLTIEGISV